MTSGVDVINMSFYTDPWLFNCTSNPADSPAEQAEQKVIRTATQRAINYARHHGVLPIAAARQRCTPTSATRPFDDTSPDYPVDTAHDREHRQLLHQRAGRDPRCGDGQLDRLLDPPRLLLQLRHGADRRRGAGRRCLRHARQHPRPDRHDPRGVPEERRRSPRATSMPPATSTTAGSTSRTARVAAPARTTRRSRAPRWLRRSGGRRSADRQHVRPGTTTSTAG